MRTLQMILCLVVAASTFTNSRAATKVHCLMANSPSSVGRDDHVAVHWEVRPDGQALLLVENYSERVVYVDRSRSFSIINGHSSTLFKPSLRTESHTVSRGTVSHDRFTHSRFPSDDYYGESHTSSQTDFDRPVQPVAPGAVAVIHVLEDLPSMLNPAVIDVGRSGAALHFGKKGGFVNAETGEIQKFRKGAVRQYDEETSPLHLSAMVQYSFHEKTKELNAVRTEDYVQVVQVGGHLFSNTTAFTFKSGGGNWFIRTELAVTTAVVIAAGMMIHDVNSMKMDMPSGFW